MSEEIKKAYLIFKSTIHKNLEKKEKRNNKINNVYISYKRFID